MKRETTEETGITQATPPFKGYTIEEIRYQRAMLGVRKEFCKAKVMESISNLRPGGRHSGEDILKTNRRQSWLRVAGSVASKVLGNLNAIDYVLMGISVIGTVRKGMRLFGGKKK